MKKYLFITLPLAAFMLCYCLIHAGAQSQPAAHDYMTIEFYANNRSLSISSSSAEFKKTRTPNTNDVNDLGATMKTLKEYNEQGWKVTQSSITSNGVYIFLLEK